MKRILSRLCLALLTLPSLRAAELTPAELGRANEHLVKSSAAFQASIAGLSDAQLNFKSDPSRWSVAEAAEHIAASEDFLMGMITGQVMAAPARPTEANLAELDAKVLGAIADRTNKVKAPEPIAPNNRFGSTAASRTHFVESRAKTVAFLNSTKGLRDHAIDSPVGQPLDAYQWVLFISAHTERHTKQIDEVKADANFPKS